jgi:hypothetical protein
VTTIKRKTRRDEAVELTPAEGLSFPRPRCERRWSWRGASWWQSGPGSRRQPGARRSSGARGRRPSSDGPAASPLGPCTRKARQRALREAPYPSACSKVLTDDPGLYRQYLTELAAGETVTAPDPSRLTVPVDYYQKLPSRPRLTARAQNVAVRSMTATRTALPAEVTWRHSGRRRSPSRRPPGARMTPEPNAFDTSFPGAGAS